MATLFWAYLIGSAAMSVVALGFLALLPSLARRTSARSLYAALLLITAGFAMPLRLATPVTPILRPLPLMAETPAPGGQAPQASVTTDVVVIEDTQVGRQSPDMPQGPHYAPAEASAPTKRGLPATALCAAWALGAAGILSWHTVRHLRFMRTVRRWRQPVRDEHSLRLLETLMQEADIRHPVALMTCAPCSGPMLVGLWRPVVLLPDTPLDPEALALVLRHELVHLKRRDLWAKALAILTMALHWFNPVIYLLLKALSLQCEIACDAAVLMHTGLDERKRYGAAIIGLTRRRPTCATALSTTFHGGIRDMKQRLTALTDMNRKRQGTLTLLAVLLVTLLAGAALAAETPVNNPPTSSALGKPAATATQPAAPADELMLYAPYGLSLDAQTGRITFQGKWVRMFEDFDADGNGGTYCDANGGEIDVYTVYDAHGALTGLGVHPRPAYEARTAQWQAAVSPQGDVITVTLAEDRAYAVRAKDNASENQPVTSISFYVDESGGVVSDPAADEAIAITISEYMQAWETSPQIQTASGGGWYVRDWSVSDIRTGDDTATANVYVTMESAGSAESNGGAITISSAKSPVTVGRTMTLGNTDGNWTVVYGLLTPDEAAEEAESIAIQFESAAQAGSYAVTNVSPPLDTQAYRQELADMYAEYAPFGLTYDQAADALFYGDRPVRYFLDVISTNGKPFASGEFHGTMRSYSEEAGEIDLYTTRDESGVLTAILPYSQAEFDQRTADWAAGAVMREDNTAAVSAP